MSVVARLNDRRLTGQRFRRIPHPYDDEVVAVIEAYRKSTAERRQAMVGDPGRVGISLLCTFPDRLAAIAMRTRSAEPLRQGLVALGMVVDLLDDPRDHLHGLAAINHSAVLLRTDLSALTDSVAGEVPPTAVVKFREFAARADRDKSLEAFGLRTSGFGDQFRYCWSR